MSLHLPWLLGPKRRRRLVFSGAVALSGIMLIVVSFMLVAARKEAWDRAEQATANVKQAVLGEVRSQLSLYGTLLDVAAGLLSGPESSSLSKETTAQMLTGMVRDVDVAGVIIVLDKHGYGVLDSSGVSTPGNGFSDRPYFQVHRDRSDVGLYVGQPYRSRLRNDDPSFALSRRISDSEGNFAGVIVAAIRLEHFRKLFSRIDLGENSALSLVNEEGVILMRHPSADGRGDVGREVSRSPIFRRIAQEGSGTLVAAGTIDGVERLVSFGRVSGFPLVVNVSVATRAILEDWWRQAVVFGGASLVVCGAVLALALSLQRKIEQLEDARAALAVTASTDGLTGLLNRRAFDEIISREWHRAIREKTPISFLIIDADHFKAVNDEHGHAEGDRVLRELAQAIKGTLMRPGDVAARYGGEEFAVILPNTSAHGALAVAENVRAAAANVAEEAREIGRPGVTVSIGAVSRVPSQASFLDGFIADGDHALYEAKTRGRNQSVLAEPQAETVVPLRSKMRAI